MNQKSIITLVVIVLILVGGYLGRHQIKSMLGMSAPAPAAQQAASPAPLEVTPAPTTAVLTTTRNDAQKGDFLADANGMALYIYDKDTANKSNCTGTCLTAWPPFKAPSADATNLPANFGVITNADGSFQYTYKQLPLYFYAKDIKEGDTTGDGVGGVWHLVKP